MNASEALDEGKFLKKYGVKFGMKEINCKGEKGKSFSHEESSAQPSQLFPF